MDRGCSHGCEPLATSVQSNRVYKQKHYDHPSVKEKPCLVACLVFQYIKNDNNQEFEPFGHTQQGKEQVGF
jgi:hypothetical protein